ncbi:MAG: hypothetical protein BGO98_25835 [Myxococcales bacterium 68-20]|nr:MAG: hypothetical protein BGO98_25835 [Myxococcales bacterium 68-20]
MLRAWIMVNRRPTTVVCATTAVFLAVAACGSEASPTEFDERPGTGQLGGDGKGKGNGNGLGGPGAGDDDDDDDGTGKACATSTAEAERLPLHMVVVLDKSGSMCILGDSNSRDCNNANSRWKQVTGALSSFFGNAGSAGITASLIPFPANGSLPSNSAACTAASYQTPAEANVLLPDTQNQLTARMSSLTGAGGTPTRYAMEGAVAYAQTVEAQLAGKGKVVIVLATDGVPEYCSNNTIATTSSVAQAVAATIPTYVIGVGGALTDLNALAVAGGTNAAFIISTANAGAVGQSFAAAMETIRGASLTCEYSIPAPPEGKTLDYNKVNIQFTPDGGTPKTLPYSADCANVGGWRYDSASAPTKILLCDGACATAKADAKGKIDVVLGCQTVGDPVK